MHPESRTCEKENGQEDENGATHVQIFFFTQGKFIEYLPCAYYIPTICIDLLCSRPEGYEQNSWSMYSNRMDKHRHF